jgi:hypothetical protein
LWKSIKWTFLEFLRYSHPCNLQKTKKGGKNIQISRQNKIPKIARMTIEEISGKFSLAIFHHFWREISAHFFFFFDKFQG